MESKAAKRPGLIVLLAKLAPKLLAIAAKMGEALITVAKSLFGIKAVGVATSIGLYTYLLTWQMAVALVVFLAVHEYGHLWAMHRCGMKTRGMFFIPGVGAVAVADGRMQKAKEEAFIALLGPVFGLAFFVFPAIGIYFYTQDALWAAIAAFMAFINLVNLFPIYPLDGGRLLKAVAYSSKLGTSLLIILGVSFATTLLGAFAGFSLLTYMAVLGLWEMAQLFGIQKRLNLFLRTIIRTLFTWGGISVVIYLSKEITTGADWLWIAIVCVPTLVIAIMLVLDIKKSTLDKEHSIFYYPVAVIADIWGGIVQLTRLRLEHLEPIKDYERMGGGLKALWSLAFVALVVMHVWLIYTLGHVPGVELAADLLK